MPIQRRLPKFGFKSRVSKTVEQVRLSEIAKLDVEVIDLDALKGANIVKKSTLRAKVFSSGTIDKPVTVKGITVSKGARTLIEAAGGQIVE